jgi:dynein heavy chain
MDVKNIDDDMPIEEKDLLINKDILKLCITRCFRPDKLMFAIRDFVSKILGDQYISMPPANFNSYVWPNTTRFKPILVMMGENIDSYEELKLIKAKSKNCSKTGDEGLKIIPCGTGKSSKIARTVIEAAINGHWVLLDNIHLCLELLPNI